MSPPAADADLAVRSSNHNTQVDEPIAVKSLTHATDKEALVVKQDDLSVKPEGSVNGPADGPAVKYDLRNTLDGPLKYSGSLDAYKSIEITPVIGREYPDIQLTDLLNNDEKVRDLAILGTHASD
jgi:hypothetical protein